MRRGRVRSPGSLPPALPAALLFAALPWLVQCGAASGGARVRALPPPPAARASATVASVLPPALVVDPALQALLDPYPAEAGPSWLGGDVASSIRLADDRWVWIFGDTLLGELRTRCPGAASYCDRRVAGPGAGMIANSAGTMIRGADGTPWPVVKYWRSDPAGTPAPIFATPGDGFLWPLAGVRVGQLLLVTANRHTSASGLAPVENLLLRVWNPDAPPDLWLYDVHPLDGFRAAAAGVPALSWTAALVVHDGHVYLFGSRDVGLDARTVVARLDLRDLGDAAWTPAPEYLTDAAAGLAWSRALDPARLHVLDGLPGTSEATVDAAPGVGWYTFQIAPLDDEVRLYTADDLLGPWRDRGVVYAVPARWRATRGACPDPEAARAAAVAEGGPVAPACEPRYAAYAPKSHPELAPPGGYAVSYNVNTWAGGLDAAVDALEALDDFYVPRLVASPPP